MDFKDVKAKIEPLVQSLLIDFEKKCDSQNKVQQIAAFAELIRHSTWVMTQLISYKQAAEMLEALAKDLRIKAVRETIKPSQKKVK